MALGGEVSGGCGDDLLKHGPLETELGSTSGFGFRFWSFAFRGPGLGLRVEGLRFRVEGLGLRTEEQGLGFRV